MKTLVPKSAPQKDRLPKSRKVHHDRAEYEAITVLVSPATAKYLRELAALGSSIEAVASGMIATLCEATRDAEERMNRVEDAHDITEEIPRLAKPMPNWTPEQLAKFDRVLAFTLATPATIMGDVFSDTWGLLPEESWTGYLRETMEYWLEAGDYPAELEAEVKRRIALLKSSKPNETEIRKLTAL